MWQSTVSVKNHLILGLAACLLLHNTKAKAKCPVRVATLVEVGFIWKGTLCSISDKEGQVLNVQAVLLLVRDPARKKNCQ